MKFELTVSERKNLLECFAKLFGENSSDFLVTIFMNDEQLCEYWSKNFD